MQRSAGDEGRKTEDIRRFRAYFQYFRDAFAALGGGELAVSPEHALLVFLEVYDYADLGKFSAAELKDRLQKTWKNIEARAYEKPAVKTEPPTGANPAKLLTRIIGADHLNVAFVHNRPAAASPWTRGHEAGRADLEEKLENPNVKGTFILMHHPIMKRARHLAFTMNDRLEKILRSGKIKGIFNGHVHSNFASSVFGVPQFTSESLKTDFDVLSDRLSYNDRSGYQIVSFDENGDFLAERFILNPKPEILVERMYKK